MAPTHVHAFDRLRLTVMRLFTLHGEMTFSFLTTVTTDRVSTLNANPKRFMQEILFNAGAFEHKLYFKAVRFGGHKMYLGKESRIWSLECPS